MGFISQLRRHAEAGAAEAVATDGVSLTWLDLLARIEAGAAALHAAGIGPGTTVGVMIADEVEHFIASLALIAAGAWQITLASHDTATERETIAERARVTHVLAGEQGEAAIGDLPHLHWPLVGSERAIPAVSDGGLLLRTSGTTGTMNLVPVAAADLVAQAARHPEYAGSRLFRPASIEHNVSKRHRLYCAVMGGTNIFRAAGAVDVVDLCVRHRVTALDLSLLQVVDLAATPRAGLEHTDIRLAGSAVPYAVRARIEQNLTTRLYVRYGSTESGTVSVAGPGEHDTEESSGRLVPGIELQIVDEEGSPLATGEAGHIRMRGAGLATNYVGSPEQAAKRFRDGWFWPGDQGMLGADGSLRVLGRTDDMINLNGINIFPSEIERVLEAHPDVRCAAALALPSAVHGQIPVAAVELRGEGVVTERELVAYARDKLALRAPRRVIILPQLPRNSQDKIVRREIVPFFSTRGRTLGSE